jgi:hypothetical protein
MATDIKDVFNQIPSRDWLLYKKELQSALLDLDLVTMLIILADQQYKRETGKHDLNRFLDMNLADLKAFTGIETDDDEPASE